MDVKLDLELLRDALKCCSFVEADVGLVVVGDVFTRMPNV